jgi:hypothetical protein
MKPDPYAFALARGSQSIVRGMNGMTGRSWIFAAGLTLALATMTTPAQCQNEPQPARSYARKIILADGIAVSIFATGAALGMVCFWQTFELFSDEKPDSHWSCPVAAIGAIGGLAAFAFVPAVIHGHHGRGDHALLSIALRIGMPLSVGALTLSVAEDAPAVSAIVVPSSFIGAAILDYVFLARTRADEAAPAARLALQPYASREGGGLQAHLVF